MTRMLFSTMLCSTVLCSAVLCSAVLCGVLTVGVGCSSDKSDSTMPAEKRAAATFVVTKDSPYYKNSPAQPMPPDGTFRAGTEVHILKSLGSYKFVQAKDGTKAYVASDALKPSSK